MGTFHEIRRWRLWTAPIFWRGADWGKKFLHEHSGTSEELSAAFLDNVNHRIRNPLNIIAGNAELLGDRIAADDPESAKSLSAIVRATRQLERNLRAIIDLCRLEKGGFKIAPAPLRITQSIRWQILDVQPEAEEKGLRVSLEAGYSEQSATLDEYCFANAIANLLDNAVRYTQRGTVTVRIRREAEDVFIDIEDTGSGFDTSVLTRVCRPFASGQLNPANRYGMGLGLPLAKSYLALNGADLSAKSEKGGGSVFTIRLPGCGSTPQARRSEA